MRWLPERRFRLVALLGILLACVGLLYLRADAVGEVWNQWRTRPIPWTNAAEFHATIKDADRIVVRAGGFNCCQSARELDRQKVIARVTNPAEIQLVHDRLVFDTTHGQLGACMCCGDLGIDWYRNGRRIALTAYHDRGAIRWRRFRCGYRFPGWSMAGDAPLTKESSDWLKQWLVEHGVDRELVGDLPTMDPTVSPEAGVSGVQ